MGLNESDDESSKKVNTHLKFLMELIEEIILHHLYAGAPGQTGPNSAPNPMRLIERHFISLIPATANKQKA